MLASIVCFPSLRSLSSHLEGNGWGFTGRTRRIRYAYLCCLFVSVSMLTPHELFARRGNLPNLPNDPWTTFELELREPQAAPIPGGKFDFTRFLVSSIPFMAHLREVSVYVDDERLVHLTKDVGTPKELEIPWGLSPHSATGFTEVRGLKSTRKWLVGNRVRSVLTTATLYSPAHYRRSHGMGL